MIAGFSLRGRLVAGAAIAATILYLAFVVTRYFAERDVAPFNDMIVAEHFVQENFLPHMNFFTAFTFDDNQHRPVFPLYVFAIDHLYFASRGILPVVLSWISIAGVCLICLRRLSPLIEDPTLRLGFLLILLCLMFWPGQFVNLVWTKQFHACFSLLCMCIAFSMASGLDARIDSAMVKADRIRLALLPALTFVGAFSFGWGLIAASALAVFVLWRRWPLPRAAPILLTVILTTVLYGFVWKTFHRTGPELLASSLADTIDYLLLFVGSPFWWLAGAGMTDDTVIRVVAESCGAIGLGLGLWALGRRWRRSAVPSEAIAAGRSYAELLVLFGLACAVATLAARVSLGPKEALASRYLFAPTLYWLALPFAFSGLPWRPAARFWFPLAGIVGLALAIAATTPLYFSVMADRLASHRLGTVAAVMGEDGIGLPPKLRGPNQFMHDLFAEYAARGTSVYADGWPRWLGQNAAALVPTEVHACRGALDIGQPVPQSQDQRVDGWIWDPAMGDARAWLALVGGDGRVIGLATSGFPGPAASEGDRAPLSADFTDFLRDDRHLEFPRSGAAQRTGFVGYLRGGPKDLVEIFGWYGGDNWCRLPIAQ